jgi:hypothetical protein
MPDFETRKIMIHLCKLLLRRRNMKKAGHRLLCHCLREDAVTPTAGLKQDRQRESEVKPI